MHLPYEFQAHTIAEQKNVCRKLIKEMNRWLKTTSLPDLQEEFVILFLIACQNDLTDTQNTIQAYFRIKNGAPEMFNDRDIDNKDLKKAMKVTPCCSLPKRLKNNTVIHCFRLIDTNYRNFDLIAGMKLGCMLVDVSQRYNPPSEVIILVDAQGANIMHLLRFKISALKAFIEFLQEGMPLRVQTIHLLNTNYVLDKILDLAGMFTKNEMLPKIKTHPHGFSMEEFHNKWIPASHLPEEYGGSLPSFERLYENTWRQFEELKPFFEAEERLRKSCKIN